MTVLVPVLFVWCTVAFCWLAVKNVAGYYVFTCFYAAVSGGLQSLIPTSIASITPRLNMVGTRLGMGFGIVSFAALTGPPIGGALQGADGGKYIGPQAWAACVTFVSFILMIVARFLKGGLSFKAKC
jgi:MFS family permease